ncbi:hypothetical protein CFAM422_009984 [Trichoderma lentiforme]|uniref:Uncharacterized protein n=1 Tax=Trichoderma lentiforme TaxID=1567552 RepID=A0A9P5C8R7_9HYPO|nr:hypothetical protein CFAM422_009984 [Trichoderma lentiforme]
MVIRIYYTRFHNYFFCFDRQLVDGTSRANLLCGSGSELHVTTSAATLYSVLTKSFQPLRGWT